MKKLMYSGVALMLSTGSAFAAVCEDDFGGQIDCTNVPEISALQGTAALAALAAIVLLAWERRRRAA